MPIYDLAGQFYALLNVPGGGRADDRSSARGPEEEAHSGTCRDDRKRPQDLPRNLRRRSIHTRRYAKQVPGHHIQVDVKFLSLERKDGTRVRRFQYTAIDDATRIRALKAYRRHTQKNACFVSDSMGHNQVLR